MEEERIEYLRELISYFIERHNIPEEEFGDLFYNLSIIYFNTETLTEEQFKVVVNILVSANPSHPLSDISTQLIQYISMELETKGQIEDNPASLPDVEYLQNEGAVRIFLSTNKQRYVFRQEGKTVKVKDIATNNPLIEGGIGLLFKKW
jgi:hypothetical protein